MFPTKIWISVRVLRDDDGAIMKLFSIGQKIGAFCLRFCVLVCLGRSIPRTVLLCVLCLDLNGKALESASFVRKWYNVCRDVESNSRVVAVLPNCSVIPICNYFEENSSNYFI